MAPSPEYDKEPKAPDKSATNISNEDPKVLHNLINDQQINSDHIPTNTTASAEVENNKHVEALDDGQLRALLDEAITYKCPKDREGKSILFKELLEEVEQDEQECEARGRRALPHSNSLQDLVAALAAEPAPRHRHHHRHHAPAPAPSNVSARAIHGGSLPSGVNTSSMVSDEPTAGAGYLATVRCVNPPPLAERRVSASDANAPHEMDLLNRRSKPMFPMTYTARATLEIGSGSVCSGRAVTTTTASNQVQPGSRTIPPALNHTETDKFATQFKLMSALYPKAKKNDDDAGGDRGQDRADEARAGSDVTEGKEVSRGPNSSSGDVVLTRWDTEILYSRKTNAYDSCNRNSQWVDNVNKWYEGLTAYSKLNREIVNDRTIYNNSHEYNSGYDNSMTHHRDIDEFIKCKVNTVPNIYDNNIAKGNGMYFSHNSDDFQPSIMQMSNIVAKETKIESLYSKDINVNISPHNAKALEINKKENCDNIESDISLWKQYRKRIGEDLVVPRLAPINPKNIRSMSIGRPSTSFEGSYPIVTGVQLKDNTSNKETSISKKANKDNRNKAIKEAKKIKKSNTAMDIEMVDIPKVKETSKDIELVEVSCSRHGAGNSESFSQYCASQQKLILDLETTNVIKEISAVTFKDEQNSKQIPKCDDVAVQLDNHDVCEIDSSVETINIADKCIEDVNLESVPKQLDTHEDSEIDSHIEAINIEDVNFESVGKEVMVKNTDVEVAGDRYVLAELPNNACVFLTFPQRLLTPINIADERPSLQLNELECNNNEPYFPEVTVKSEKKKKGKVMFDPSNTNIKKYNSINRNALSILLYENLLKSERAKSVSDKLGMPSITDYEVDSAIPFSCITTPEVVASCNTTSSTSQSTVAVDPKPRSVISTTFNGLPLSRPNYGATASTAPEDFKKSLDENGNSVQGFSSPLSGSSQHKKPRRKKSSKNETVIDCEKIDGYQGDKDVNELLRFIESNVESARGHKLGRAKHKDDSDDKSGKKRSSERRKDKESKLKRASSLEELSRTKLEDLTDAPEPPLALRPDNKERRADLAAPKPERRSWGDDARDAFSYRPPDAPAAVPAPSAPPAPQPAPAAPPALASQAPRAPRPLHAPEPAVAELTDFQTVTKRRKQRRRTDDADPNPPPRRARHAHAPPSDRSNDSNDDLDSVHSLPDPAATAPRLPPPPPPPPQASYADIARTRHNIPDLIESCNFYAEGEALSEPRRAADPPPAAAPDAEGYPALEPRAVVAPVAGRRRDKPPAPPAVARRSGKERSAPPPPDPAPEPEPEPESPAPDVVGERRPPVILLDSASRPRDLDGVTFGFDINEQLLGGGGRRPRCDLVRDAVEAPGAGAGPGAAAGAGPGMSVRAGCRTLRYVPPNPPHSLNTQQVVDYVGNAWEELMRSGDKVRYYNE